MTTDLSFTGCRPVFPVTDLDATLFYYTDVLGFELGWRLPEPGSSGQEGWLETAYVHRGDFELLVRATSSPVSPVEVVVGVPSTLAVDAIQREYEASGARILDLPGQREWGTYEMVVVDPDGHLLRILH